METEESKLCEDEDVPKRRVSVPRLLFVLLIFSIVCWWIRNSVFKEGDELEQEEDSETMTKRIQELEKARKEEEDFERDFNATLSHNDTTEMTMGAFRYKLFKEPHLPYQPAFKYCKRMSGRLAMLHQATNTRLLQRVLGKQDRKKNEEEGYGYHERTRNAVWVGRDRPKKKKKPKKDETDNGDDMMGGMGGMGGYGMDMMGGGGGGGRGEEMCPAINPVNIYVPAPCQSYLPFICQFDKTKERKPRPPMKEFDPDHRYRRGFHEDKDEL